MVADKYKSDTARFAAEGLNAEAKRLVHELAASQLDGLKLVKQHAAADAAHLRQLLQNERDKADTAGAVKRAQHAHDKALRHTFAEARAEGFRLVKHAAAANAEKERQARESAQQQAVQAAQTHADRLAADSAQKHELALVEAEGYRYKKEQLKVEAEQERLHVAKEREQADQQSQVRADANESDKQLLREMQAARTEGLRSLREQKLHTAQQEKLLLANERERAAKANLTRQEAAAVSGVNLHNFCSKKLFFYSRLLSTFFTFLWLLWGVWGFCRATKRAGTSWPWRKPRVYGPGPSAASPPRMPCKARAPGLY
jgi:hypothetical protein